ncbi:MAG: ArsR/SmtB family transcription factor [Candidatus Heimdallarchaeota archaeon]
MTEYSPLFAELANPARFQMLALLVEAPHTLGEFAKKIEVSKPEISRHLTRLVE